MTHVPRVLVLDAEQRSALAAARSLGQAGAIVSVASACPRPLAGASRHVRSVLKTPDPLVDVRGWLESVAGHARTQRCDFVLPMTDVSTMLLASTQDVPADLCRVIGPPAAAYDWLTDKGRLLELAQSLGMNVPVTLSARDAQSIRAAVNQIGFPAVIKPSRSRYRLGNRICSTSVRIVKNAAELDLLLPQLDWLAHLPALVQAWIAGHGAGVFALYGPAGPVAWFAHRRLREKPPAGGVSVLCESTTVDPGLRALSETLLSHVGWWGPAMVEYRIAPDGRAFLMEVNGRFWGSLQLSVDAGVNFPLLLLRLAQGQDLPLQGDYQPQRRLRWLLGDVDNLLLQFKGQLQEGSRWHSLKCFAKTFFDAQCRQEILRSDDRMPALREASQWFRALL